MLAASSLDHPIRAQQQRSWNGDRNSRDPVLRDMRHRADGLVVGTKGSRPDTYRVMFHLASLSRGRFIARDVVLDKDAIPYDVNWLVLMPGVNFSGVGERRTVGPLTYVKLR